jgi:hypothetical protein
MDILKSPSYDLLKNLLNMNDDQFHLKILELTLFLDPDLIHKTAVWYPNCVRTSKKHHGNKRKGEISNWNNLPVKVCDNSTGRRVFEQYTGFRLNSKSRNIPSGINVAHIWGRVFDPDFFTAGWNLCLMPDFIRSFTEEQSGILEVQQILKQVSYDLYFRNGTLGQCPKGVNDQNLCLKTKFPQWKPRVAIGKKQIRYIELP